MKEIGKGINLSESYGEFIGIAKFSKAGATLLAEALEKIVRRGDLMLWFESAIHVPILVTWDAPQFLKSWL